MKRYLNKKMKMLAMLVATLFFTVGCSDLFNNPLQDKETGEDLTLLLIDFDFFDTKVIIEFIDHETEEVIDNEELTVLIGSNVENVFVNLYGEYSDEYTVNSGYLEIYLDPAYNLSTDNPLEYMIAPYNDRYFPILEEHEITEPGTKNITVRLLDLSDEGDSQAEILLKSTNVGNINIEYNDHENIIKKRDVNYQNNSGVYLLSLFQNTHETQAVDWHRNYMCNITNNFFSFCPINTSVAFPKTVNITATSEIDDLLYSWGLSDNYVKDYNLSSAQTVYSQYKATDIVKCPNGLLIQVDAPGDPNGNGTFEYSIIYSSGQTTKGKISGNFSTLKSGVRIQPIYYPGNNPATRVILHSNKQYTTSAEVSLSNPCGTASFTATKIPELKEYKFSISYSCSGSSIGIAYTGTGRYKQAGTNEKFENFTLSSGGTTLQLYENALYQIEVLFEDEWYPFTVNTNPENILQTLNGQEGAKYKINGATYTTTDKGYHIKVPVSFTDDKVCEKLTSL